MATYDFSIKSVWVFWNRMEGRRKKSVKGGPSRVVRCQFLEFFEKKILLGCLKFVAKYGEIKYGLNFQIQKCLHT